MILLSTNQSPISVAQQSTVCVHVCVQLLIHPLFIFVYMNKVSVFHIPSLFICQSAIYVFHPTENCTKVTVYQNIYERKLDPALFQHQLAKFLDFLLKFNILLSSLSGMKRNYDFAKFISRSSLLHNSIRRRLNFTLSMQRFNLFQDTVRSCLPKMRLPQSAIISDSFTHHQRQVSLSIHF